MLRVMKISRIVLLIISVLFFGVGIAGLLAPASVAATVSLTAESNQGLTELRAMYGGLQIGIALFIGLAAMRPQWMKPGLILSICVLTGLAAGRFVGLQLDGGALPLMLPFALLETGGTLICLWALHLLRQEKLATQATATSL